MPTINTKDLPEFETVRLIDLTEDSINHIAEAIVSKLNKSVRHGHWVRNDNGTYSCSECQSWIPNEQYHYARYCLFCGAKMDEEK